MARPRLLAIASVVLAGLTAPTQLLAQESDPVDSAATLLPDPDATAPATTAPAQPADAAAPPASVSTNSETTAPPAGNGRATAVKAATKAVSVGDNFYSPKTISISVGDTIKWTNNGQAPHTATANDGSFDTGTFNSGQSRSQTFDSPGTISYYCTIHGQVQSGTIKVAAASSGGGGGGKAGGGSDAASDTSASAAQSEATATAAPDAAGNDSKLPATGSDPLALAVAGLLLLGAGLLTLRRPAG